MERLMGPQARETLAELRRIQQLLEEAGLIREGRRDIELTPRAIRRLGENALRNIFAEMRRDRAGQHEMRNQGASTEQQPDTKAWEFGDLFLVDIGKSISNAVKRGGPGTPVKIDVKDLEVFKQESLIHRIDDHRPRHELLDGALGRLHRGEAGGAGAEHADQEPLIRATTWSWWSSPTSRRS